MILTNQRKASRDLDQWEWTTLLAGLVVSHSPSSSPESNKIFYLGPSLLVVGGLVLFLSISLLIMRLSKTQQHREADQQRKLKRSHPTVLRVKSFPFSSSPQQPGLAAIKVPKIIITRSTSMENKKREKTACSPFRLRHKVSHDLGASSESLVPRPFSIENESRGKPVASQRQMSDSVIPVVSVIML